MYGAGFKTCPIFFVIDFIPRRLSECCVNPLVSLCNVTVRQGRGYGGAWEEIWREYVFLTLNNNVGLAGGLYGRGRSLAHRVKPSGCFGFMLSF